MLRRCAWLLLLVAAPALADSDATNPDGERWRRELAGHVFIPSLAVTDPFLDTYLSVNASAGFSWIDGPGFDLRGNVVGRNDYIAAALAGTVTFQASLARWLAARISGGGGLNGGYNGRSALVVGLVQPLFVNAGVTASWRLHKIIRFGGTFDFTYSYSKLIQPLVGIRDSLVAGQVDSGEVSQHIHGYTVVPGAALAVAPHPMVGLLASVQYLWNGFDNGVTSEGLSYFVIGVSGQIDLRPRFPRAPIGFLLSYRTQIPFQSGTRFTHTLETGIFYTGRHAIDLGIDLQVRWFDLRPDTRLRFDTTQLLGTVLLRYHWN